MFLQWFTDDFSGSDLVWFELRKPFQREIRRLRDLETVDRHLKEQLRSALLEVLEKDSSKQESKGNAEWESTA